ncbi:MAG TPA: DUF6691 family protein [Kofleriaceae bacterium]
MPSPACGARCRVMSLVLAGVAGLVFGGGLIISGMTQPAKVIAFLDVTRHWDPSLMFVMGGGVVVYMIAYRAIRMWRKEPWFDARFHLPTRRDLDAPLLLGAALFGIGWGLGGLCPGPGIVSAASGSITGLAFVAAMLVGMHLQHRSAQ